MSSATDQARSSDEHEARRVVRVLARRTPDALDGGSSVSGSPSSRRVEEAPTALADALVTVACTFAVLQIALEIAARQVAVGAVPALMGFHSGAVVAVATAAALVARWFGVTPRPRTPPVEASAHLVLALLTAVAFVAARLATSTVNPSVRWLVPIEVIPALALALDLIWTRRRAGRWRRPAPGAAVAQVWLGVAALAGVAAASLPAPDMYPQVQSIELRWLGASIAVVAVAAAVVDARRGRRAPAGRLGAVALCGLGSALLTTQTQLWPVRGATILVLLAVATGFLGDGSERRLVRRSRRALLALSSAAAGRCRGGADRLRRGATRLLEAIARTATPDSTAPQSPLDRSGQAWTAAIVIASATSIALRVAWAVRVGWQPTGNVPTVMARAWDVGTVHTPLVGTPTSLGTVGGAAHPGPLLFDVLAPFVRLLGLRNGAFLGSSLLNLGCWMVAVWAAFRAGGRSVAIGAWLGGALVIHVAALGVVWDPFNISVVLMATYAALVASWAAAAGVWRAWWWAVGLGSLSAQAYLAHALLVVGPVLWAGLVMTAVVHATADPALARRVRSALRGGLLIAVVAWFQPALDVVLGAGGNVRALTAEVAAPRPAVGLSGAWRAVGWLLSVPPQWGRVTTTIADAGTAAEFLGGPLAPGLLVMLVLAGLWWRRRSSKPMADRQLRVIAVLLVMSAVVNVTQLPRTGIRTYTVAWLVVASIFVWFTVIVATAFEVSRRWRPLRTRARARAARWTLLAVASVLVIGSGLATPAQIGDVKGEAYAVDPVVPSLIDQVVDGSDGEEEVLVLGMDTQFNQVTADTIVSNLIVRGRQVRVEPGIGNYYGERRMVDAGWSGTMLWVTNGSAPVAPDGRRIARVDLPGWTRQGFDDVAERVSRWAAEHGPIRLQPSAGQALPKYLTGWIDGDVCAEVARIERGQTPVASLPAEVLAWLYADGVVLGPMLPDDLHDEVAVAVGQAPIEVWEVEREAPGEVASERFLRDGSTCRG